ncbi:MAG: TfoX/Sxy family protein [Anaerolineales bacterium]|jgi:TfoX/Sxy family transcriptional regulator of competence genes
MAYDETLAQRARETLAGTPGLTEKKMFGGVGFLLNGNMACGVHGEGLIVRVGPEDYESALSQTHTQPFDLTGRPMRGWVVVQKSGYQTDDDLRAWVQRGVAFARTLAPK